MKKILICSSLVVILLLATTIGVLADGGKSDQIADIPPTAYGMSATTIGVLADGGKSDQIADIPPTAYGMSTATAMSMWLDGVPSPTLYPTFTNGYYPNVYTEHTYRITLDSAEYDLNNSEGYYIGIEHGAYQPIKNGYEWLENRWFVNPVAGWGKEGKYTLTYVTPYMIIDTTSTAPENGYQVSGTIMNSPNKQGSITYTTSYDVAYPYQHDTNGGPDTSTVISAWNIKEFYNTLTWDIDNESEGVYHNIVNLVMLENDNDYDEFLIVDRYILLTNLQVTIEVTLPDFYTDFGIILRQPTGNNLQTIFDEIELSTVYRYDKVSFNDVSFVKWITTNVNDFFSIQIIKGITIGSVAWVCLAIGLVFAVLKIYAGG